jgi:hypothetical protein
MVQPLIAEWFHAIFAARKRLYLRPRGFQQSIPKFFVSILSKKSQENSKD